MSCTFAVPESWQHCTLTGPLKNDPTGRKVKRTVSFFPLDLKARGISLRLHFKRHSVIDCF